MHPTRPAALTAIALCALAGTASAQLRIAAWNISNYTGADRAADIQTAVYAVNAANGLSFRPDVIAVQEIVGAAALSTLVNVLNTAPGSPGDWAAAPYLDDPNYVDTESSFVYRTSKVQLLASVVIANADGTTTDQPRSTYRYDFRPLGYTSAGATIGIYSVHLKAGSASSDNDRRFIETTRIRNNATGTDTNGPGTALPAGYNFIMAGDTNMQSNTQTSYVALVGSQANNAGRFFDPINSGGSWNNNSAYRFIHTQDPANAGGGGMDDRHDQMLCSAGLLDGQGLSYIGNSALSFSTATWNDPNHSYRCWGNDGSSYNVGLTTTGNSMVGAAIAQALINCATTAGGHLPVYADFRVPAKVSADAVTLDFGTVTQGSAAPVRTLTVSNAGNVTLWGANGIDTLNYSLGSAAGFTIPTGAFSDAAGGAGNAHALSMSTATPGIKNTTFTITSDDPDQPARVVNLVGTVVPANQNPVANAGPDQSPTDSDNSGSEPVTLDGSASHDDGTIVSYLWREGVTDLAQASGSPTLNHSFPVGVHTVTLTVTDNLGAQGTDTVVITVNAGNAAPTANAGSDQGVTDNDNSGAESVTLDGSLSSDTDGTIVSYLWSEGLTDLAQASGSPTLNYSFPVGVHTVTLRVTDDDGAQATDTVTITVDPYPGPVCDPIDFNNDGLFPDTADIDDFLSVFSGGPCSTDPAPGCGDIDFNNDGLFPDTSDIDSLLSVFSGGPCL
ncbi:MAG: PKD domain-containing protein [Phycisphaerales bacterium]